MKLQDRFVLVARVAVPGITDAAIAERIGLTPNAVYMRQFNVPRAVERWNDGKNPPMRYTLPSVDLWGASVAAK